MKQEDTKNKKVEKVEDVDKDIPGGSSITDPEEKAARKYDDWRSHKHEKQRGPNDEFRESELHGVVGKEIEKVIEMEKPHVFKNQKLDYGNDIYKENTANLEKDKHKAKDFNNKVLDTNPREAVLANQYAQRLVEKIEHQNVNFPHKHEAQHQGETKGENISPDKSDKDKSKQSSL